ncbi:hypothetical protein GCM10027020_05730 [Nocardioides salsibiostraticola]
MPITPRLASLLVVSAVLVSACGSDPSPEETTTESTDGDTGTVSSIDPDGFLDGALTEDATTTDCTLVSGTDTSCYELTVAGFPANRDEIGPWCPETTSDTAEDAGIWFDGETVYDVDGEFITSLAEIYDDPTWKLYDDEGNVLSTDTSEKFNDLVTGGAQADADAGPVNLCVYGEIEWTDDGGAIPSTVTIPVTPVVADEPTSAGTTIGVTLDGVVIDGSAPIDLILGNYTIGVFDDCGGHVNPQEGYHMHATTGCSDADQDVPEGETAIFGYALDGFGIHAPYETAAAVEAGLDECNGHETESLGYHYHANDVAENAVLTCLTGETTELADAGPGGGGPPPGGDAPPSDG